MNKKKILLVGYGYWGQIIANQLNNKKNIEFIGVCESSKIKLKKFKKIFKNKHYFSSLRSISAKIKIDGAIIATNAENLYETAKFFLHRDIHCLIEKPISKSAKKIQNLINISEKKKLVCIPGYIFTYNQSINYIKNLLKNNKLGKIRIINFERTNLGPIRQDVDSLWDLASHDISILRYIIKNKILKINVFGKGFLKKKVIDFSNINFILKNNIYGFIHVSWLNPKKQRVITIVGSRKMLIWNDMDTKYPITIYNKKIKQKNYTAKNFKEYKSYIYSGIETRPKIKMKQPLNNEIETFIKLISGKKTKYQNLKFAKEISTILSKCSKNLKSQNKYVTI
jgi:predicted dehydrogenase